MAINRILNLTNLSLSKTLTISHIKLLLLMVDLLPAHLAIQVFVLLYKLIPSFQRALRRFYRVLYNTMFIEMIRESNEAIIVSSILFKSLKRDKSKSRVTIILKKALQIAIVSQTIYSGSTLILLSKLLQSNEVVWTKIFKQGFKTDCNTKGLKLNSSNGEKNRKINDIVSLKDHHMGFFKPMCKNMVFSKLKLERVLHKETLNLKLRGLSIMKNNNRINKKSHAINNCFWELLIMKKHINPLIASMSKVILNGYNINYH